MPKSVVVRGQRGLVFGGNGVWLKKINTKWSRLSHPFALRACFKSQQGLVSIRSRGSSPILSIVSVFKSPLAVLPSILSIIKFKVEMQRGSKMVPITSRRKPIISVRLLWHNTRKSQKSKKSNQLLNDQPLQNWLLYLLCKTILVSCRSYVVIL